MGKKINYLQEKLPEVDGKLGSIESNEKLGAVPGENSCLALRGLPTVPLDSPLLLARRRSITLLMVVHINGYE